LKNSIAVFFNTNKMGGAERSMLNLLKDCQIRFSKKFQIFYPLLDGRLELNITDIENHKSFNFPLTLYNLSRSGGIKLSLFWDIGKSLVAFYKTLSNLRLEKYQEVWFNGNKVAYPILFYLAFKNLISSQKHEGRILWFWRDYPLNSIVIKYLYLFFESHLNLILIANSQDVKNCLKSVLGVSRVETVYPLPEHEVTSHSGTSIKNIGVPAMLSPWKGQMEVLIMIKTYQEELKKLGILKFFFFGDQIYQTQGAHQDYKEKLLSYKQDHNLDMVSFEGIKTPETILDASDLVIHSTLSAEPFGRIIIEAFMAKIPVISTGLGGAGELVENEVSGLRYEPYSKEELFQCIKRLSSDSELRQRIKGKAYLKYQSVKNYNKEEYQKLFA
jgi:glycosyltransferase involved in cell wall biosynthesis